MVSINTASLSALFDSSASQTVDSSLAFSNDEVTLSTVTKALLNDKYNIEQPASIAEFSPELKTFISENVSGDRGERLLADLEALEKLTGSSSSNSESDSVNQLLESQSGKVVDLLG